MRILITALMTASLISTSCFLGSAHGQELKGNKLKKALKQFDANGNGRLDPEELKQAMEKWKQKQAKRAKLDEKVDDDKPAPKPKPTEAELLDMYDINGNGRLDPEERLIAAQDQEEKGASEKKPEEKSGPANNAKIEGEESYEDFEKRLIAKYDKNKNQKLDSSERTTAAGEIAQWRKEQRIILQRKATAMRNLSPDQKRLLVMFDDNNDYQLDDDEREFAALQFRKLRKGGLDAVVELHDRLLDQFDTNKNGKLEGREKTNAIQFVFRVVAQIEAAKKRESAASKELKKLKKGS
jgi:Ca2+-binding EF-hand superfamily protein